MIALLLIVAAGIGVGITVLTSGAVTHNGSTPHGRGQSMSAPSSAPAVAPASTPATSVGPSPAASLARAVISMSEACKWAYPGLASGQISGTDYSIVCLGPGGQALGGFGGAHSLNAWCADPAHTGGVSMPNPQLVSHLWVCVGSTAQPTQSVPPATASQAAAPSVSTSQAGSAASVPIPMSAACKWAYPGLASGQISGTDYSIVCLGPGGQALGGFGGAHSLNAWCADSRHTNRRQLPNPALVNGVWLCTPPG